MSNAKAADADNSILDLAALAPDRESVRLVRNGPLREMLSPEEIGIEDRAKMMKIFDKVHHLTNKKRPTKADTKKLEKEMRALVRLAVPSATAGEVSKLEYHQLDVFTGRFLVAFGNMISQVARAIGSETVMELVGEAEKKKTPTSAS